MKKDKKRVDYLTQEDNDNSLILLQDVKKIFAEKKVDRIFTADLIKYLCETPYPQPGEFEPKSRWVDYNGFRKSINHTQLARLLNIYGVHSLILKIGKKRLRGYERGHFEKLEPISYDLLKWLQNDWNSCYVSLGDMWGAGIPTQETLDAINDLESHGWLKLNFVRLDVIREKVWRIRSKSERNLDRRKTKTVGGVSQPATTINPEVSPTDIAQVPSFKHFKLNIADTEPAMRFKKYLEEVRTIPDSENITEENIIKRFLRGLYRLFGWKE